ncbi:hypothetical protein ACHAXR_003496 [Thalassiosira sp. AJA248-18]
MVALSKLCWHPAYYYLIVFILPSLSSPTPTAPDNYPPSLYRIDRTFFVSSWKVDTNVERPRTKINNSIFKRGLGRTRSACAEKYQGKCGISFPNASLQKATDVALFGGMRGGADDGSTDEAEVDSKSKARGISISLFLTYLTVMGAKCALPSTLSMLTSPNSGLAHRNAILSRQDVISRLLAFSTLSIAAGKLFLGPVIDNLGGVLSLQIALSTLSICLGSIGLGMQTCPTLTSLAMYWIVVDFAFSSCWAASVKTIRDYLPEEKWSREIGRLAMAARSGNAISFAFFAWLLQWASSKVTTNSIGAVQVDTSWRWVFRASGAVQLIPLMMLSYFGRKGVKSDNVLNNGEQSKSTTKSTLKDSLTILFHQSRTLEFWLHLVSRSIIMVLVSFLLFIPSFMTQCYGCSSSASARVGSMFALGCLLSVSTLAERAYPSIVANSNIGKSRTISSSRRKAYSMLAFLTLATICLVLQASFLQNFLILSPTIGALLMFVFGFSLAIPFYLPSSMFALKRGGEDGSATIADAFDVCGFGLLAVFNGFVARVLDVSGETGSASMLLSRKKAWLPVFAWMLGGSIIAMVSLFWAVLLEGERDREIV